MNFFINYLLKHNNISSLSEEMLKDIAINISSDIPLFLSKLKTAYVSEFGSKFVGIKSMHCFIDVYPINIESNTKLVYEQLDKDKNFYSKDNVMQLYNDLLVCNINKNEIYNDLQKYCFQIYPDIKKEFNLI